MKKFEVAQKPEVIYFEMVKEAIFKINGKVVTVRKMQSFKDYADDCDVEMDGYEQLSDEEQLEFDGGLDKVNWHFPPLNIKVGNE